MRFKTLFIGAFLVLSISSSVPLPAHAQSFFQTLFGFSKPSHRPRVSLKKRHDTLRYYGPLGARHQPLFGNLDPRQYRSQRRYHPYNSYRTVCVRSCDGFYFPISSATSRNGFHKDANVCHSRCGTTAELYYMPRRSNDISNARNLSGQTYDELENAFKYRKTLVNGCACRPMPWSLSERARHRRYEYVAAVERSYALAEARAKKRAQEEARLQAREQEQALATREARRTQNLEPENTQAYTEDPELVFDNSHDFHMRWLEVSRNFATPYYALALRQNRESTNTLKYHAQAITDLEYYQSRNAYRTRAYAKKQHRIKKARHRKKKKTSVAFSGLFGKKKPKYRWPGD